MYTAIVPARPHEPFLLEAVESMLSQSCPPEAVIVVINGVGANDSAIRLKHLECSGVVRLIATPLPSQPAVMTKALQLVTTPLVAFLDADDLWTGGKQAIQVDHLTSNCEADIVVGATIEISSSQQHVAAPPSQARLFSACTFRMRVFERIGTPDPAASHFTWVYRWWFLAQRAGVQVQWHNDVVLLRRIHQSNSWVTQPEEGRRQLLKEIRELTQPRPSVEGSSGG
jgi:glycosyltransferase involved in cell wall biosynthesis